jgi:hypothetical protein
MEKVMTIQVAHLQIPAVPNEIKEAVEKGDIKAIKMALENPENIGSLCHK